MPFFGSSNFIPQISKRGVIIGNIIESWNTLFEKFKNNINNLLNLSYNQYHSCLNCSTRVRHNFSVTDL